MINYLSYSLSENTQLYGNGSGLKFSMDKQISHGDSCNTMSLTLPNHSGTHIDAPFHFNPNGKKITDYPPDFWIFDEIEIIDLSGQVYDGDIIHQDMFPEFEKLNAELLLIITGYGKYRGSDRFTLTPPGLSHELASYLRTKLPNLRCLGMDLISLSSFCNRDEGRKAHKAFLSPDSGEPILLLEDMKLDSKGPYNKVIVAPLLIKNADGTPCTVFAFR